MTPGDDAVKPEAEATSWPEPARTEAVADADADETHAEAAARADAAPDHAAGAVPAPEAAAHADTEPEPPIPFPVPDEVADQTPEELAPALAAVCFALNRAVTVAEAASILGRSEATVSEAADHLAGSLRGGGLMLQRHQSEIQLVTRPEVAWAVQRALNPEKPGRLSRAALETLAIVAYRQPLTRAGVEAIRGVNCEAVLDSLERRGLIAEVGRQDSPGHPRLFGTTMRFLQVVGLERIEDLPPLPQGLIVPELPAANWDISATEQPPPPSQPGDLEVRGFAADPDEGYVETPEDDAADDGGIDAGDDGGIDAAIEAAFDPPPADDGPDDAADRAADDPGR